jgi:hypothetical protein
MRVEHPIYTGDLVTGVGEHAYFVGKLKAGEYYFQDARTTSIPRRTGC